MKAIKYILIVSSFCLIGCVEDVDFDQKEDIEINTTHVASLVHFDLGVSDFIDDMGEEVLSRSDTTKLSLFGSSYNENYLVQVDFDYTFSLSFNRTISFTYEFLDADDTSIYVLQPIIIPANTSNYSVTQSLFEADILKVVDTKKVVVNLHMSDGVPKLEDGQFSNFNLMSAATFYYKVTVDE